MCGTDSLKDVGFLFALKTVQPIHAQDINVAGLGYLVPKLLELNRRIRLPLCPEDRRTLATRGNTRVFSRRHLSCGPEQITCNLGKNEPVLGKSFTMNDDSVSETSNGM